MPDLTALATRLQELATARGVTVAAAESCTGGNIAHQVTSISGSSDYFLGAVVSYANAVKRDVLKVPAEVLENPGAVSEPCARAMVEGVRALVGTDFAVSTTGIAGPGGGTARKPVGTVFIGVASATHRLVEEHHFAGDRAAVIAEATARALELLITAIDTDAG